MAKRTTSVTAASDNQEDHGAAGHILGIYLAELNAIHGMGGGVAETSYYPALSNLFNAVASTLKPKVRCVMNLKTSVCPGFSL